MKMCTLITPVGYIAHLYSVQLICRSQIRQTLTNVYTMMK